MERQHAAVGQYAEAAMAARASTVLCCWCALDALDARGWVRVGVGMRHASNAQTIEPVWPSTTGAFGKAWATAAAGARGRVRPGRSSS